jgi:ribosome-binding protein aMBF1 (putative translation factor)
MRLENLIEQASAIAGSQSKLARMLDTDANVVTAWKTGRRTCSPEDRALLADIAGVDPIEEIAEALLERCEGKPKAERLAEIFRKRKEPHEGALDAGEGDIRTSLPGLA